MPLADTAILAALEAKEIAVEPFDRAQLQPTSVDVRLGPTFLVYQEKRVKDLVATWGRPLPEGLMPPEPPDLIDLSDPPDMEYEEVAVQDYVLKPGAFVLGATAEILRLGPKYCAHFDGRSTLGRLGLIVHVTAGFCDPGFEGNVTLEIKNVAPYSIRLYEGCGIGQLIFHKVEGEVAVPYGAAGLGSKYGGLQTGPRPPVLRKGKL